LQGDLRDNNAGAMGEYPDLPLLQRWENEHFEQIVRERRFLAAHPDILIGYSARARGWVASWRRDRSPIVAEYDLRTLMNTLEKVGWLEQRRNAALRSNGTRRRRVRRWRYMRYRRYRWSVS
jgi:hypothetical protein